MAADKLLVQIHPDDSGSSRAELGVNAVPTRRNDQFPLDIAAALLDLPIRHSVTVMRDPHSMSELVRDGVRNGSRTGPNRSWRTLACQSR